MYSKKLLTDVDSVNITGRSIKSLGIEMIFDNAYGITSIQRQPHKKDFE